jgi:hypothetical protein
MRRLSRIKPARINRIESVGMTNDLLQQLKAARRVSVPIVSINTPDPAETITTMAAALAGGVIIAWDIVDGLRAVNRPAELAAKAKDEATPAEMAVAALLGTFDQTQGNPIELFRTAKRLPKDAILFVSMADRLMTDPSVIQAIWNLRDLFKANGRMLVLLSAAGQLPPELAGDVVSLDEPLPEADRLATIVRESHDQVDLKIDDAGIALAVEAVQGLPAFQAEQTVAMSLKRSGIDLGALWERKRKQIEQTPGLKVQREPVKFSDIGGVEVIKSFLSRILGGKTRPNAIVFIDEIEKFMAGSGGGGDSSGVSQDQLGQLLSYMQDQSAAGCIFVGPPGSAKSMVAKATGSEAGVPTISLDLGGMKGSLVGQSEQNLRNALKVITAVSNGRTLWIATCNAIADLPPELRRRFTLGTFFFDLPDADERASIWDLYLRNYSLKKGKVPDEGWTGAEIRQCCDIAWRLGCTVDEAGRYVVPVSKSASEQLERLRKAAEGRFLSASKPGVYSRTDTAESAHNGTNGKPSRRISVLET